GPVHCWQVARILRLPRILIPFGAGAISAFGLLAAPLAFDFVRTEREPLDRARWERINRLYGDMEEEGRAILASSGITGAEMTLRRSAEMRYAGQGHDVEVEVPLGPLSRESLPLLTRNFEAAYRALYHRTPQGVAIEALNWRLLVSGPVPELSMAHQGKNAGGDGKHALKGRRQAFFAEARGFVETPVYDRYRLGPGASFEGPAIVEERESTAVIGPGGRCRVDEQLTMVVEL
ncbi:MAG: hydantoinase/oxoprolinase family protein, partial [Candidatus Rokubacteria bacterium]|nr:hydantoinase/oxoprolinase family protein [Candidatus Rokubacteria bacterium]